MCMPEKLGVTTLDNVSASLVPTIFPVIPSLAKENSRPRIITCLSLESHLLDLRHFLGLFVL